MRIYEVGAKTVPFNVRS